jgi:glycosyltransferase involved in cell wall biosynthesis
MNILVYDVAANGGGGITVLEYYYRLHQLDKENHYYYLISGCELTDAGNIHVIRMPYIQKSWLHRIYFDIIGSKRILKNMSIDYVLSLQNTVLPSFKGKQVVYVHNAIPFSEYKIRWSESKYLWVYQNIIGKIIYHSIKKADEVIVQTHWMKKCISTAVPGAEAKTIVSFPEIDIPEGYTYQNSDTIRFFYPANPSVFKNHQVILGACRLLKQQGISSDQYRIAFTLQGNENIGIQSIHDDMKTEGYPVDWLGTLNKQGMFDYYSKSILLFPSYIETVGLPIYEAKAIGCSLILANCNYSREVADGYDRVDYFEPNDPVQLAEIMKAYILEMMDD